jgi:ArpU family phage transcriptional regulator
MSFTKSFGIDCVKKVHKQKEQPVILGCPNIRQHYYNMEGSRMGAARKWKKPEHRKKVERLLCDFVPMKESLKGWDLFPSCVPAYGEERGSTSSFCSSTERYAIKRAERRKLVQQIEKALNVLSQEEREVIERTYFEELSTIQVCMELKFSERTYRRIKSRALEKIAVSLNLA